MLQVFFNSESYMKLWFLNYDYTICISIATNLQDKIIIIIFGI